MPEAVVIFEAATNVARELALFAAIGFLIGGIDDLAVDWLRAAVALRQRIAVGAGKPALADLPPRRHRRFAIFVPAWDEARVIGAMLGHTIRQLASEDYWLFVGCYPNDPATIAAARQATRDTANVRIVIGDRPGPTTKADCLNRLWAALEREERASRGTFKAVILHDAEDVVHPREIELFDRTMGTAALVQIPVIPLVNRRSRWISGHYCDEFAEAHGKDLVVRDALASGLPSAGVGCAIDRAMLGAIAAGRRGAPFFEQSLTEDYEMGLRIAESGGAGRFVRALDEQGNPIAVRSHFPARLDLAVRQKTRWITGIALHGWTRLGWSGGWSERWMRLRDRRSIIAAIVLVAAYASMATLMLLGAIAYFSPLAMAPLAPELSLLLLANAALLGWRLLVRAWFTWRCFGWREGLRAVPRALVSNIIAIMAARRALAGYLRHGNRGAPRWDKTAHIFPHGGAA